MSTRVSMGKGARLVEEWSDPEVIIVEGKARLRAYSKADPATRTFPTTIGYALENQAPVFGEGEDAASTMLASIVTDDGDW